jgi:hypothetical protein
VHICGRPEGDDALGRSTLSPEASLQVNDWEPLPHEWRSWLARKATERNGGPKEPVNPLARLIENAEGALTPIAGECLPMDPDTARQGMKNMKAFKIRRLADAAMLCGFLDHARELLRVADRLTPGRHTDTAEPLQYVHAHWPPVSGASLGNT